MPPNRDTTSTEVAIRATCTELADFLCAKNAAYGNSALAPIRVFSHETALDAINIRLDDKLSRIKYGADPDNEDVELDLLGYLVLRRIARQREGR